MKLELFYKVAVESAIERNNRCVFGSKSVMTIDLIGNMGGWNFVSMNDIYGPRTLIDPF